MWLETDGMGGMGPCGIRGRVSLWRALLRGVLLGVAADVMGTVFLWGAIAVPYGVYLLAGGKRDSSHLPWEGVLLLLGVATFIIAFLPTVVAGGANALVLYKMSGRGAIGPGTGLLVGSLIGAASAIVLLLTLDWVATPEYEYVAAGAVPTTVVLAVGGIGAVVGAWHGWQMARWLRRAQCRGSAESQPRPSLPTGT